jgi:hypothetical protein
MVATRVMAHRDSVSGSSLFSFCISRSCSFTSTMAASAAPSSHVRDDDEHGDGDDASALL